jgi:hypothetical protein
MLAQGGQSVRADTLAAVRHPSSHRQLAVRKRAPPIPKHSPRRNSVATTPLPNLPFPAIVYQAHHAVRPNKSPDVYLSLDLKTPRLNAVHRHLWLAGLPNAARPLHRQKLLGRSILLTEDPDEHLVWFEAQIFVKPLPEYLLDYDYWSEHLCSDHDLDLHQSACGLLLSYAWLVRHQSDLAIAQDAGLLSKDIAWPDWVQFLDAFLDSIDLVTLGDVSMRYRYGELRLSRLNIIYRLTPPAYSLRNVIRGFRAGSTWCNAFFGRHFRWTVAVFAALSVVLSALQVGLATPGLQNSGRFQRASFGFTVAALVAVVTSAAAIFVVWLVLFWYHLLSCWWHDRAVESKRRAGASLP